MSVFLRLFLIIDMYKFSETEEIKLEFKNFPILFIRCFPVAKNFPIYPEFSNP